MILYHGSNIAVEKPEIIDSKRYLDFGLGFYLTSDYEQAKKWAHRKAKITNIGVPSVSIFDLQENILQQLKILSFSSANKQWLNFVCKNRKGELINNKYDIIIGPVANDNTIRTINNYLSGYLTEDIAIQLLLTQKLKDQYTFKNRTSLSALVFKESIIV